MGAPRQMVRSLVAKASPPPVGLKNRGNTCFFNATAQCLLSIPGFAEYFKHGNFSKKDQPLSAAFRDFILGYQNVNTFDPRLLISEMQRKIHLFDNRQQDAHCFLEAFFNELIEEQEKTNNTIQNMFGIKTEDVVICKDCRFTTRVTVTSLTQYLFIKRSVQSAIDSYGTEEDEIDPRHPWTCPSCRRKGRSAIRHVVLETSKYIIIHLNRFSGINTKNGQSIVVNSEIRMNDVVYENIGVVCHVGGLNNGHYFAKCKRNGMWYEFNDASVDKTDPTFAPDHPYLIFYSRKDEYETPSSL